MLRVMMMGLLALCTTPAWAADAAGIWAMKAGDVTVARFEIAKTGKGWTGVWERARDMDIDNDGFDRIGGPTIRRPALSAKQDGDVVELIFDDPRPGATPDIFRISVLDATHVQARYASAFDPYVLERVSAPGALGPFDPARHYARIIDRPTNAEMTAIFDADQAARRSGPKIDWSAVGPADDRRRARTQALLDVGALASGDDYYHAAFVFQHGGEPGDYLKAHTLATIAAARGKSAAAWIAAATLDRYLMAINQPQIFGTQYQVSAKTGATQEPYDRALLSDALRRATGVPVLADQETRRAQLARDYADAAKTKP